MEMGGTQITETMMHPTAKKMMRKCTVRRKMVGKSSARRKVERTANRIEGLEKMT